MLSDVVEVARDHPLLNLGKFLSCWGYSLDAEPLFLWPDVKRPKWWAEHLAQSRTGETSPVLASIWSLSGVCRGLNTLRFKRGRHIKSDCLMHVWPAHPASSIIHMIYTMTAWKSTCCEWSSFLSQSLCRRSTWGHKLEEFPWGRGHQLIFIFIFSFPSSVAERFQGANAALFDGWDRLVTNMFPTWRIIL